MRPLLDEYRRSLKLPEAEELLDRFFYRPVAFVFVKAIYRLPITPNGVTLLSLAAGLLAAWGFAESSLTAAGLWYMASNILDCSDGQLARLQKSGTPLGRLVDGAADYIASVAIFLGLGVGLSETNPQLWWLVVAAGLSSAAHAFYFDFYQGEFISVVRGEENSVDRELETMAHQPVNRSGITAIVMKLYVRYLDLQKLSDAKRSAPPVDPERYRDSHLSMIRRWSFLGPTTNRSLLIACALAGRLEPFLWIVIIPGNAWLAFCLGKQSGIRRALGQR